MLVLVAFTIFVVAATAFVPDEAWSKRLAEAFDKFSAGQADSFASIMHSNATCCLHGKCGGPEIFDEWKGSCNEGHTIITDTVYKDGFAHGHYGAKNVAGNHEEWFEGEFLSFMDDNGMITHHYEWYATPFAVESKKEKALKNAKAAASGEATIPSVLHKILG
jgi:hypothetical protein